MGRWMRVGRAGRAVRCTAVALGLAGPALAGAVSVEQVTPQGEVGEVRQVRLRFDAAAVPAGDARAPAPVALSCNGRAVPGSGYWTGEREWVFDLQRPLPPAQRCTLARESGFTPSAGAWQGPEQFTFATGAPAVLRLLPSPGQRIDEAQHFVALLNGAVSHVSVARAVHCEVEGLGDRIPVKVLDGAARETLLQGLKRELRRDLAEGQHAVVLACQRPLPPEGRVRLVWGAGVAAAESGLASTRVQRWQWPVRPRFTAEFSCERESARAACLPLRPLALRFSERIPREQALAIRLQPLQPGAPALLPRLEGDSATEKPPFVEAVQFAAPLPPQTRWRLVLPPQLRDDSGRVLANAASFPLEVATGPLPPLAKFAAAPFGILEAGSAAEPAMLPLTLRHVQADLQGPARADAARTGGELRVLHLGPATPDATLVRWIGRLQADHDESMQTREKPLLDGEPAARRSALPQTTRPEPQATEVLGLPLPQRGYHVVEAASRILGRSLLARDAPMYARTGVLVTNLGVHFKRGRDSSLVWVTTLDRARPVADAAVAVNDCHGRVLWSGRTGADGIARVPRGFAEDDDTRCPQRDGLFVSARSADGSELGFVFSRWARGIEPWRFNVATGWGGAPERRAHTVFDRTLLRAGETVSMKHFLRLEASAGLVLPTPEQLPDEVELTHDGSGQAVRLPLAWPRGARAAESSWRIPAQAPLGRYTVTLRRQGAAGGGEGWALDSGSFRVGAFRVPLVDARLAAPGAEPVAPKRVVLQAQLNAMAGGPMPAQRLSLSALLRPRAVEFAAHPGWQFGAPEAEPDPDNDGPEAADPARLVADRLAAQTDARGAAQLVIDALPPVTQPSELQAELSFADPNGEVQTVGQRVRLWPAAVVVGLKLPERASVAASGPLPVAALVLDTAGRPLADRAVSIRAQQQRFTSTRQRLVGGFYAYDNRRETLPLGTVCEGRTNARGELACTVALKTSGEVQFIASAADDAGRTSQAAASAWLHEGERWWFAQDNDDRIELVPERRELEPGQTARLQVRMPFSQATALVTVEREGVLEARVLTLSGARPVIELPVPRAAADGSGGFAPNVFVSALVLRGRLREAPWWSLFTWGWQQPREWLQAFRHEGREWRAPSAMVDLAKPAFKLGLAELQVGRADHRLEVGVSTPALQYRVRDTVPVTVSVRAGGRPLPGAEVAFAAVDEGLLALQPNDSWALLEGLLQPRPWSVETATAQGEVIGRRHFGRKAAPPGGGGGGNPTRELFDTLLLWRGTVTLDAQGQARIDVPLNDSLTRFRLVAVADDGGQRFGTGHAVVRVTQELQMLSGIAPVARQGDRFEAGFTLRNGSTRPMTLRATLAGKADGQPLPAAFAPQTLTLAPGAAQELRWPVQVPPGATALEWLGTAEETTGVQPARDRIAVRQAVAPAVPLTVQQATLVALDAASPLALPLAPPAAALPGSARVQLALQPRLSGALPGLRHFFATYPYTCLEQKTSRAIGLRDEAAWKRLGDEALGYLDGDGLAGYFPPPAGAAAHGSERLTAYLLAAVHEAGWAWPAPVQERLLQGLQAWVDGRVRRESWSPQRDAGLDEDVRRLAALEALARHGRVQPRQLGSVAWQPARWPTSALLDAWSLYRRTPALPEHAARLAELQQQLRSRLVAGGTTLRFSTEAGDDWWWLMDGPDANAARLVLAALDVPAWTAEAPRLVSGALARQRGGAWRTTTANLWGVLALERFAARFEATPPAGRSHFALGPAQAVHDWAAAPEGGLQALPLPAAGATLQARHEGPGRAWLAVQALAAVPLAQPQSAGYTVSKSVTPLQRARADTWSRGDLVRVRLEVQAQAAATWVVLSDPIPAGATVLGQGGARDSALATRGEQREGTGSLAWEERSHEAWRGYWQWLPRGRHVVEYTLRLNTAGTFALPPTRVEAMYAPESFGERPNAAWTVQP